MIPTIDLSRSVPDVAAEIDAACASVGFFQIVGHGLDPAIESAAWETAQQFFRLPLEAKLELAIPADDAYGYGPFQSERLAASLGNATPPDLKETFSIGPFEPAPPGLDDDAAAFVYSPNRWPSAMPAMEAVMEEHYRQLARLVEHLMSLMAVGLGLPADYFAASIDRHTSALRALHYPDVDLAAVSAGQLRAGAHSDYGTLTLLRQDHAPGGLQVRDVGGAWHDVAPIGGAYVVNVGDALERWTNDRWRSTLHRVRLPPAGGGGSCERFSMAFFHNANWDAVLECIPTCLAADHTPKYPPVTAGRHLMDKFRSTQGGG